MRTEMQLRMRKAVLLLKIGGSSKPMAYELRNSVAAADK
jgi:hypothetical protein